MLWLWSRTFDFPVKNLNLPLQWLWVPRMALSINPLGIALVLVDGIGWFVCDRAAAQSLLFLYWRYGRFTYVDFLRIPHPPAARHICERIATSPFAFHCENSGSYFRMKIIHNKRVHHCYLPNTSITRTCNDWSQQEQQQSERWQNLKFLFGNVTALAFINHLNLIRFIHSSTVMWHAHESKRKPHASHPIIARLLDDMLLRRWKKRKQLECIRRKIGDKSFNDIQRDAINSRAPNDIKQFTIGRCCRRHYHHITDAQWRMTEIVSRNFV